MLSAGIRLFSTELMRQEKNPAKGFFFVLVVFKQTPEQREVRNFTATSFDKRLKLKSAAALILRVVNHAQQSVRTATASIGFRIGQ